LSLDRILSLDDFEHAARRHLPRPVFAYVSGGVEDDASLRDNRAAFDELGFVPRTLVNVSQATTRTTLFGTEYAAPFGVAALALLGEVDQASDWVDLATKKHVDYLLPHALTSSGTNDQSSNFWASTMTYRIFFCDALQREQAIVALGSRMGEGTEMPRIRRIGNTLYALLLGSLSGRAGSPSKSMMTKSFPV